MTQDQLMKMSTDDQVSYWMGQLLVAIGEGKFRSEVYVMIELYQRIAFERGVNSTKK